ncbi:DUF308 domain-containing protein [Sphingomonas sp. dw_22]|uniref:DUF308 domain-containing protein n=1 Tax=Sphingomonas sp. dw_22 TaxID=2721175 RepID=UPI001BD66690|nr:DUF308 domain-containing protein [Sphingomonas sp. dw_22]
MNVDRIERSAPAGADRWLQHYYLVRAGVSALWVAAAATLGVADPVAGAALLVAYPAWDALANVADARRNGGARANPSQALNAVVSGGLSIAVLVALGHGMHAVLALFGIWAGLAGLFQLLTGIRRWKSQGAQWAMILSGAQSALAGGFFLKQASGAATPTILDIAPYAAFGAFYFLVSGVWLAVRGRR